MTATRYQFAVFAPRRRRCHICRWFRRYRTACLISAGLWALIIGAATWALG